jgi:AGZA family xanthine/uracil permease-like MFS transporter
LAAEDRPRLRLRIVGGDVNGFLGLALDNLSVLALLAALLIGVAGIPASVVFGRMFPGTTLGVLVGDLIYTWLALRLARRAGREDVTAMPFGLDTPSTIGMALLVLGPAFARFRAAGLDAQAAGLETWYLGMASTVIMGAVKLVLAFAGRRVQRMVPQAGLLGSLAGIALMLIGFLPLVELFDVPIVGLLTLGLVLYALVANGRIPGRVPGVLFAVIVGTLVYYFLGRLGLAGMSAKSVTAMELTFALPHPDIHILRGFSAAWAYLPLTLPFALITVIGGVNNTESARVAGDDYDVRSILVAEALATLAAGLTGGIAQTTPYIGHSAYKRMGARAGYTLLTGVFVGLGGMLGYVAHIVELVPIEALAPVTVFIAMDITVQAFRVVPLRHAPAVAVSFFPAIARMLTIELSKPEIMAPERFAQLMQGGAEALAPLAVIVALGNGFILTATLWGAFVVEMTEGRLRRAALYLFAGALLCLFGIIHSVRADGSAYCLWNLSGRAYLEALQFCLAYAVLGVALVALSLQRKA